MDTVTQVLLGAAVGHVALGAKVGRRALVWGGVLGLAPDLDVLISYPDAVSEVTEHRGFSHSLLVHAAAAPVLGAALSRLHPDAGWGRWTLLAWLALSTHALLDAFTIYGTQLFWPSAGPPIGLGSVFIIDPLYSLPLLVAVLVAAFSGIRPRRGLRACAIALALSTSYLAVTAGLQQHVRSIAVASARGAGLPTTSVLATPAPFNVVLWRVVTMYDGGYAEGFYSLLDERPEVRFEHYESDEAVLGVLERDPAVQRLRWFTRGYHRVREEEGEIVITDLRMGFEPKYVFSFVVGRVVDGRPEPVSSRRAQANRPRLDDLDVVWSRLLGR